jgi:hypothetical protein
MGGVAQCGLAQFPAARFILGTEDPGSDIRQMLNLISQACNLWS